MPRLPLVTERLALFATLLATFGELHPACDHPLNAAKAVSTFFGVSLPRGSRRPSSIRGSARVSRLVGIDLAPGSALLGVMV